MPTFPPRKLKRGFSYINRAFNDLLQYVETTKVIPGPGWVETPQGILPPFAAQAVDADSCTALVVSINAESKLVQTAGTITDTTAGSDWNGEPTLFNETAFTAGDKIYVKVSYSATDTSDEASTWKTTAIAFEADTAIPADTVPVYTTTWTSGVYHMAWATLNAGSTAISYSECGPCRIVYCSATDVRIIT